MVTTNHRCSECGSEMLLSHVVEKDNVKTYYYACVNPNCREKSRAYSATGKETESMIKEQE